MNAILFNKNEFNIKRVLILNLDLENKKERERERERERGGDKIIKILN